MRSGRKQTILGRYAIYLGSLSETVTAYQRTLFGGRFGGGRVRTTAPRGSAMSSVSSKLTGKPDAEPKKPDEQEQGIGKLETVVNKAQNVLIKSKAVFPFDLFPDSITIDRQKMTVVHRSFFNVKQTVSVQHSDIKNIQADIGPFLGSLTVTSEHFINNIQVVKYLPKREVLAIQQLVQGFIVAHSENIDLTGIDDEKLVELLNRLGRGEAGEKIVLPS